MLGWQLRFSVFCQLANMHICVSSFIADTKRQVLIYCSPNNCAGINPALTGLCLENKSASLQIIVTHVSEHSLTGIGRGEVRCISVVDFTAYIWRTCVVVIHLHVLLTNKKPEEKCRLLLMAVTERGVVYSLGSIGSASSQPLVIAVVMIGKKELQNLFDSASVSPCCSSRDWRFCWEFCMQVIQNTLFPVAAEAISEL